MRGRPICDPLERGGDKGILAVPPEHRRVCGGARDLRLEGYFVAMPPMERLYAGTPEWLTNELDVWLIGVVGPAVEGVGTTFHLDPSVAGLELPLTPRDGPPGQRVAVTGHYNDPAAEQCQRDPPLDELPPMTAAEAELWCAQRLAVTEIELLP